MIYFGPATQLILYDARYLFHFIQQSKLNSSSLSLSLSLSCCLQFRNSLLDGNSTQLITNEREIIPSCFGVWLGLPNAIVKLVLLDEYDLWTFRGLSFSCFSQTFDQF